MLIFINVNDAKTASKKVKNPESVLEKTQNRIRNYVAWTYGVGNKITTHKPATIVVKRDVANKEKRLLAIKIANETFNFVPLDRDKDEAEQILEISEGLAYYKTQIWHFSQWVDFNVGKPKDQRMSRPENFETPIASLSEAS
jgi:hypothetical protein